MTTQSLADRFEQAWNASWLPQELRDEVLTALRESGEAIERAAKAADERALHHRAIMRNLDEGGDSEYSLADHHHDSALQFEGCAEQIRALKPEPSRCP